MAVSVASSPTGRPTLSFNTSSIVTMRTALQISQRLGPGILPGMTKYSMSSTIEAVHTMDLIIHHQYTTFPCQFSRNNNVYTRPNPIHSSQIPQHFPKQQQHNHPAESLTIITNPTFSITTTRTAGPFPHIRQKSRNIFHNNSIHTGPIPQHSS